VARLALPANGLNFQVQLPGIASSMPRHLHSACDEARNRPMFPGTAGGQKPQNARDSWNASVEKEESRQNHLSVTPESPHMQLRVTPESHQSHTRVTRETHPPQSHIRVTPESHQSHTRVTPESHQSHTRVAPESHQRRPLAIWAEGLAPG
jgi:hypothetical protein